jgi:hypothetical protein
MFLKSSSLVLSTYVRVQNDSRWVHVQAARLMVRSVSSVWRHIGCWSLNLKGACLLLIR